MQPNVQKTKRVRDPKHDQDTCFGILEMTDDDVDRFMSEYAEIFEKLGR